MAKMSSLTESLLLAAIKTLRVIFMALPLPVAMRLARGIAGVGSIFFFKKKKIMYANMRVAFAGIKTPQEIRRLGRRVLVNFFESLVELLCISKIREDGFETHVDVIGQEYVEESIAKGNGAIFLAVHSGNWELANVFGASLGHQYNIVAHSQSKTPRLDSLLHECRVSSGAHFIPPGSGTREIIKVLKENQIVSLVLDQGGANGHAVPFLGKSASMSTGALRLAMKYGSSVNLVWIKRVSRGKHQLQLFKPVVLGGQKTTQEQFEIALTDLVDQVSELIRQHPDEYMWFYKMYKYSDTRTILIIDDKKIGHLRQSEGLASTIQKIFKEKGIKPTIKNVSIEYKNDLLRICFGIYVCCARIFQSFFKEEILSWVLTPSSYQELLNLKADVIVSAGSQAGPVNYFIKRCYGALGFSILRSGLVPLRGFDLAILPWHDKKAGDSKKILYTKTSLSEITPGFIDKQHEQLLSRFSHMRHNTRPKIGVLLGGDTKGVQFDEGSVRALLRQIKDAALHFNADILLTTSRRTSKNIEALVYKELKSFERTALCIIANEQNVPEAVGGILGASDMVLVSGESVSMVSEALASGKRTIVFRPTGDYAHGPMNKYDRFVLGLSESAHVAACGIKELSPVMSRLWRNKFMLKPLDERKEIAQTIERILASTIHLTITENASAS